MNMIACCDRNWAIGKGNRLLARIPDDLRLFREMTIGKVVVMGRKTREGIPGGRLEQRINLVLTHDCSYQADGVRIIHSREGLWEELKPYDTEDIFIAGGGQIYRQFLDACDTAFITKIENVYEADIYMPNLDERPDWELAARSERQTHAGLIYYFCKYERRRGPGYD